MGHLFEARPLGSSASKSGRSRVVIPDEPAEIRPIRLVATCLWRRLVAARGGRPPAMDWPAEPTWMPGDSAPRIHGIRTPIEQQSRAADRVLTLAVLLGKRRPASCRSGVGRCRLCQAHNSAGRRRSRSGGRRGTRNRQRAGLRAAAYRRPAADDANGREIVNLGTPMCPAEDLLSYLRGISVPARWSRQATGPAVCCDL
jgi:hypothetical protein